MASPFVLDVNLRINEIIGLEKIKQQLSQSFATNVGATGGGAAKPSTTASTLSQLSTAGLAQSTANLNKFSQAGTNAATSVTKVSTAVTQGAKAATTYADSVFLAGRRYSAFVLATSVPFAGIAVLKSATESVIEFDRAITKLDQVLQQPRANIEALRSDIIKLSTTTGTSIKDLSEASLTLAQAGFFESGQDFAKFLEPLSKIPLLPTFKDIDQAVEGVIASLSQFKNEGLDTAIVLDKLTAVADKFAVESQDLIDVVQRAGGTFAQVGGNFDELLAIFTAIRATTRESSEAVATALRNITARLARPATVNFLEGIGVATRDAEGQLLGVLRLFENISQVFQQSSKEQQALIADQLGGIRNISRVFAALNNTDLINQVLEVSRSAAGAVDKSAEKALQSLGVQIDIMTAKFQALAQSLAAPVFIPLIQGLTIAGTVLSEFIGLIGPALPLLGKLGALIAGLTGLNFVASRIGAIASTLSKISTPGIFGLSQAGTTGADRDRETVRRRLGLGGAGAEVSPISGIGAALTSPVGQLAGLFALNAIAGNISEAFSKTDDSLIKLGASALQATTTFIGFASIISGNSVIDLLKSSLGQALAGGALISSFAIAAATQKQVNIDSLVDKAAQELSKIKITATRPDEALNQGLDVITSKVADLFNSAADEFDTSTLSGLFGSFGKSLSALLSADIPTALGLNLSELFGEGIHITETQANDILDKIIGSNPEILSSIINNSILEFGANFVEGLDNELSKRLIGLVPNPEEVGRAIRGRAIERAGGFDQIAANKVRLEREQVEKQLTQQVKNIGDQLSRLIIPERLSSDLIELSEAVKRTVNNIDSSVNAFEGLTGTIGQLRSPQLPTSLTTESVRRGLQSRGSELLGGDLSGLSEATQTVIQIQDTIKNFIQSLTASKELARTTGGVSPEDILSEFTDNFLSQTKGLTPEVQDAVKQASSFLALQLGDALSASKFGLDESAIKSATDSVLGSLVTFSDSVVEQVKAQLEAQLRLTNAQLSAGTIESELFRSDTSRPFTQLERFVDTLNNLGFDTAELPVGDFKETLAGFGTDVEFSQILVEKLSKALSDQDSSYAKLQSASLTNVGDINELTKTYIDSATQVRLVKEALDTLGKAADLAASQITDETPGAQGQRENIELVKETVSLAAKLEELRAAERESSIFVSAQERFSVSVSEFRDSVFAFSRPAQPGEITPAMLARGGDVTAISPPSATDIRTFPGRGGFEVVQQESSQILAIQEEVKNILREQLAFQKSNAAPLTAFQTTKPIEQQTRDAIEGTLSTILERNQKGIGPLQALQNIEDLRKNLQITIPDNEIDKLQIKLSPTLENFLRGGTGIPTTNNTNVPTSIDKTIGFDLEEPISQINQASEILSLSADKNTVSTESFALGTEIFKLGTESLNDFINTFGSAIDNLSAIINIPQETLGQEQLVGNIPNIQETGTSQQTTEAIDGLSVRLEELASAIQDQNAVQSDIIENQQDQTPLEIDGLAEVSQATVENSSVLENTNENITGLTTELSKTQQAIAQGVNLRLDAVQQINVDVTGFSEEISGLREEMELIATRAAQEQLSNALSRLASTATDSEGFKLFSDAREGLG